VNDRRLWANIFSLQELPSASARWLVVTLLHAA
jgi:hypothetical protein